MPFIAAMNQSITARRGKSRAGRKIFGGIPRRKEFRRIKRVRERRPHRFLDISCRKDGRDPTRLGITQKSAGIRELSCRSWPSTGDTQRILLVARYASGLRTGWWSAEVRASSASKERSPDD